MHFWGTFCSSSRCFFVAQQDHSPHFSFLLLRASKVDKSVVSVQSVQSSYVRQPSKFVKSSKVKVKSIYHNIIITKFRIPFHSSPFCSLIRRIITPKAYSAHYTHIKPASNCPNPLPQTVLFCQDETWSTFPCEPSDLLDKHTDSLLIITDFWSRFLVTELLEEATSLVSLEVAKLSSSSVFSLSPRTVKFVCQETSVIGARPLELIS